MADKEKKAPKPVVPKEKSLLKAFFAGFQPKIKRIQGKPQPDHNRKKSR